ncbi:dihydroorotase [Perkinsela sp. CCAP 1560/4]|nr:dihydroorotase [Perkinsela sp. CCAP 1560/4]|eukprot:KNH08049.1 dihydroorotase [Perkinsela sp. CCAP 1560/4]
MYGPRGITVRHFLSEIVAKDFVQPECYHTLHGPGLVSVLSSSASTSIFTNFHQAATLEGMTNLSVDAFLCGPGKRFFGRQLNWFTFTKTERTVYPRSICAKLPFSLSVEFAHSPYTSNPEIVARIFDADRECIVQTNLSGSTAATDRPVSDSWKEYSTLRMDQLPEPQAKGLTADEITLSAIALCEQRKRLNCTVSAPKLQASNLQSNCILPRHILLEIIHNFTEEAVKKCAHSIDEMETFKGSPLRFAACTFHAPLCHSDSPISTFHHTKECRPPVAGAPLTIEASLPYLYKDRVPIWKSTVGMPHITSDIPCLAIELSITQYGEAVIRGTFYFIPVC